MEIGDDSVGPRKRRKITPPRVASYALRELLDVTPLENEAGESDVQITCVEYWSELDSFGFYSWDCFVAC
jgi:vacuolar protein sorting-associated protein 3